MKTRKVAIINGLRTPFVKSMSNYQGRSNQDLLSSVFNKLVEKNKLEGKLIGDFIAGTVMNHPFDWNLSREVVLGSKLDAGTPGLNIQRACGTGLEAANLVALKIASGQIRPCVVSRRSISPLRRSLLEITLGRFSRNNSAGECWRKTFFPSGPSRS